MDTLLHLIDRQARRRGDSPAILAPGRRPLDYRRLRSHIEESIVALNALGIGRGDRVAVALPDGPEMAVAFAAVASAATCAPLNPAARPGELAAQLGGLNAAALLVLSGTTSPATAAARELGIQVLEVTPLPSSEAGLFSLGGERRPRTSHSGAAPSSDGALALYTSGTSGAPTLVSLTHRNITAAAHSIASVLELTEADRCLNVMPMFHIHGLSTVCASLTAGGSVICTPGLSVAAFFDWLEDFRPTWYTAAPVIHSVIRDAALRHPELATRATFRFIRSASAAMPPQLMADLERVFGAPVIEAYGMTEAGPQIASNRLPPHARTPGSVGKAAGPEVAIVNDDGLPVAAGHAGEIVVRGANVAAEGWLRTGDLGVVDANGDLFVTGRVKDMINRGGEKISPQEIDAALMNHDEVAQAVSFAVPHPTLGESARAAVVLRPNASVTSDNLRAFAAQYLSPSKVPDRLVILDHLPTGPTGKHLRRVLAEQFGEAPVPATDGTEPDVCGTPMAESIACILGQVLGGTRLGLHQHFFAAGGHSLTSAQATARITNEFHVELPADALFEHPTPASLAALVASRLDEVRAEPIPRRPSDEPCPLSFAQEGLWFLDRLDPGNPASNMLLALRLVGPLDLVALEQSLSEIRRRHDVLRTTVHLVNDRPVQVVAEAQPMRLAVIDLCSLPHDAREGEMRRLASEQAAVPFHLERGPLFRALALRLEAAEHVLLLGMHHIVSDGWSMDVVWRELESLYAAFSAGRPSPLADLPIRYSDFVVWQRRALAESGALDAQLAYWTTTLAGVPPALNLPADRPRHTGQRRDGATVDSAISRHTTAALKELGRQADATLFMTLLAVFQTLLLRYTGQDDVTVATPVANRGRLELEALVGCFANTLVLRGDLSGDPSFRVFLARTRAATIGAYANQEVPFETLVRHLHPARNASSAPLAQVMFAFQNAASAHGAQRRPSSQVAGLSVLPLTIDKPAARFDVALHVTEPDRDGVVHLSWRYDASLFEPNTIARMAAHYAALLEGVAANPDARLSALPLSSIDEPPTPLDAAAARAMSAPQTMRFDRLLAQQAGRTPDAVAVRCGEETLTYRELDERATVLARHLIGAGVGPEHRVAVCLQRSVQMPVSLLGILKAGAAFVPLEPDYPTERLAFVLKDAAVSVLVTEGSLREKLAPHGTTVMCIDDEMTGAEVTAPDLSDRTSGDSLAYIIYTSGSLGQPKGAMVTHSNLCHYVDAMQAALGITAEDRYLHTAPFAFSSSVRQFALPLSCGASVIVASVSQIRDPRDLFDLVRQEQVSVVDVVPSYWRACIATLGAMTSDDRAALSDTDLRMVLSASDTLSPEIPIAWRTLWPRSVQLFNMYGQTETTGIVTVYPIPEEHPHRLGAVPVGRPVARTHLLVLDARMQPVPTGVCGELFVAGATVGRGYVNQPELTAERFVPDPFGGTAGARLYRTGDLARRLADGTIELLGRTDQQVKIRGFRVELQEVEAVLNAHPSVLTSAVVVRRDETDRGRLIAYVVPSGNNHVPVRQYLEERLPDYMQPSAIVELPALPLTPNGKIDRRALAAGDWTPTTPARRVTPVDPGHATEQILASIWTDVLGITDVGVDENFFDLGGDSILSVEVIERAKRAGLQLRVEHLFRHQTIAGLAAAAARLDDRGDGVAPPSGAAGQHNDTSPGPGPVPTMEAPAVRVRLESMRAYGQEALERAGLSARDAGIMTDVQVEASLRGQPTHNVGAIPRYARRLESGATNARPDIRVERDTAISALIDGDNGPGQLVAMVAMETAIRKARESGIAIVGVRRSNHFGAAGHYAWMAARANLIGLCTTNSALWLPPTGGIVPMFGTNPLGVGVPAARHHPLVLDVSMSVTAKGKVALHLAQGKPLLPGWILDHRGRPSIEAADLSAGLGVPIGGHKGYGLAMVMEVLAGVLTGARFGRDHRRELMKLPDQPADFGHFFMAIDPSLFMPLADFTARVDSLIDQVKGVARADNVHEILVPGEAEMVARARNLREGVPLDAVTYQTLCTYRDQAGLSTDLDIVWKSGAMDVGGSTRPAELRFTRADIEQTIPSRFAQVVDLRADHLALTGGDRRWTYRQLHHETNRTAHAILQRTPAGPGCVTYLLDHSPEMVAATLAVLKAGKTYLALHPAVPAAAQQAILHDVMPQLLITSRALEAQALELAAGLCSVITLETIDPLLPDTPPSVATQPGDPSTLFYTSGTTGLPKGVVKSHRAVLHRVWLSAEHDRVAPTDRQSLLTHCSFSASESDMFGALLQGATLCTFDIASMGLGAFRAWLERERITLLHPPVLLFRRFLNTLADHDQFPEVRLVALAGDVVRPADLETWRRHSSPSCVVLHRFSITETAMLTVAHLDSRSVVGTDLDAGRPVADKELLLIDEAGGPVAAGSVGELVVRSA
ncbi:MAG: amino acid adenylation domain-containing protein, partial [Vicinamibacterales bacterium]